MIVKQQKEFVLKKQARVFFPNLDGLRFFAFFSVFLAHSFYSENKAILSNPIHQQIKQWNILGIYGVNFFFVLSGFLITYLLLAEEDKFKKIHIPAFYLRRIFRIWPLYYAIVFIGFVLFPLGKQLVGESPELDGNIWYYIFFINNYDTPPGTAILGVLWSIAIEEQFYLFWPLLLGLLFRKKRLHLFTTIIAISFIWRYLGNNGYTDTLSCISDMAVGGLGAYLAFYNNELIKKIEELPKQYIVLIYITGFILIFSKGEWGTLSQFTRAVQRLVFSVFFLFIILEQNYARHSPVKTSSLSFPTQWGRYTYGLYMLHFPVIYMTGKLVRGLVGDDSLFHVIFTETIVALGMSMFVAYISFHYFESYFLKLKERFSFVKR
ncbi:MAG: acyltransferase [Bacteroidota bacterium]